MWILKKKQEDILFLNILKEIKLWRIPLKNVNVSLSVEKMIKIVSLEIKLPTVDSKKRGSYIYWKEDRRKRADFAPVHETVQTIVDKKVAETINEVIEITVAYRYSSISEEKVFCKQCMP